ncbi:hypothetical protein C8R44DRAFT_782319 [Mycena epipterygia]|nr:hypothetical protein C8R44DRAFT_782319 [Mycena epipterygia]
MMSESTAVHSCPAQETRAMRKFYRGQRCCITGTLNTVHWSRQLDAGSAIDSSAARLGWMLVHNLRENRYPEHAAEVRENLVPLSATYHGMADRGTPRLTLFPHEDVVAKTLQYELDVREWRLTEVIAGRGDPGRPPYSPGYPVRYIPAPHRDIEHQSQAGLNICSEDVGPILPCRLHMSTYYSPGNRTNILHESAEGALQVFDSSHCPGTGTGQRFPIVNTLLSIPFALLHQTPRLQGLAPIDAYQSQLVAMAIDIIHLYSWKPVVHSAVLPSASPRRSPPLPIMQRQATWESMLPHVGKAIHTPASVSINWGRETNGNRVVSLPLPDSPPTPSFLHQSHQPPVTELADGSFRVGPDLGCGLCGDELKVSDVFESCLNVLETDIDFDGTDTSGEDLEQEMAQGFIGKTGNDTLMVRGCIDPAVYVQYHDLNILARTEPSDIRI